MTWLAFADKHPDSFIILAILSLISLTIFGCFVACMVGELIETGGRMLERWMGPR